MSRKQIAHNLASMVSNQQDSKIHPVELANEVFDFLFDTLLEYGKINNLSLWQDRQFKLKTYSKLMELLEYYSKTTVKE